MKTLLFLNGPVSSQAGIEDGFTCLHSQGKISALKWFYFEDFSQKNSSKQCILKMIEIANEFLPELIVFFHISNFPVNNELLSKLRKLPSQPLIIYDEGDMYGGFSKPVSSSMKTLIKGVDIVSIRGLGGFYKSIFQMNKNIILTLNSNWLFRFTKNITIDPHKKNKIVFIGNKIKSRLGNFFRLSGSHEREKLVSYISKIFRDNFFIYGKGWQNNPCYSGILKFDDQPQTCNESWIQLTYEHYPNIPYFFSDRIPIALSSGQIVVTNYKKGYMDIFKDTDFIYFYKNKNEAVYILLYLTSLSEEQLYKKSLHAKKWADKNLSPEIIWTNFFKNIVKYHLL
jgi:hypothetical protein